MRTVKPKGKAIDINKYINTGYDKVVLVADNMEMLKKLALILDDNGFKNVVAHLNDIVVVANSITNVVTVSGIADDVVVVANNVSDVVVVSHNIEDIKLVAEHIQAVQRVADSANNVDRLALSADALDIVATSVVSVDKVAASIDAVESVSSILSSVVRVSASADNVDIVANDIDAIKAVPTYMTEIRQAVTTTTTNAQTSTTNAASALASKNAASASEIAANASKVASKASQDAAKMSELAAYSSELSSLANAEAAEASKTAAKAAETNAIANSNSSYNYSELARGYANAAEVSKGESIQAASDSSTSASASLSSANAAKVSENAAKASQTASKASETAAKASETASKASEVAAKTSENTAIAKATQTAADAVKTGNDVVQSAANASLAEAAKNESQAIAASLTGGIVDKGAWDASTGVFPAKPTRLIPEGGTALVSAFWKVTVAGTAGGISFLVGDDLRFSASTDSFYKVDNTDAVASVQGKTGAVTLSASEVGALATPTGTFATNKVIVAGSAAGTSQYSPYTIDKSVPSNAVFTDTVYTHPTTDGNLHVPATGTTNNGKALVAGATAGSAAWRALVTSDIGGLAAALDAKLDATANAVSATKLQNAVTINGVAFDGSANITVTAASPFALTRGTGLTGANYNGAAATTWAVAYGTAAGTACQGNDARLSDARTPLAHAHTIADTTGLQSALDAKYSATNKPTPADIGAQPAGSYSSESHIHSTATTDANGFMSSADKTKLDNIAANANNYSLPAATSAVRGGIEIFSDTVQTVAANAVSATAGKTYGVQVNAAGQAVVNVPWSDTNTVYTHPASGVTVGTYSVVTVDANGHVTSGSNPTTLAGYGIADAAPSSHVGSTGGAHGVATTAVNGFMSAADKTKLDSVATGANNYTLPTATSSAIGGVKVSGTAQTVAANAVSATASRSYAIQLDASGNAVVNVPWVDTNTVYTHPTSDGSLHVPATGTVSNGKVLKAGATAGSMSWGSLTAAEVGAAELVHSHAWSDLSGVPIYASRWPTVAEIGAAASSHTHPWAQITGAPVYTTRWPTWSEVSDKPSTMPPSAHTHTIADITSLQTSLDAKQGIDTQKGAIVATRYLSGGTSTVGTKIRLPFLTNEGKMVCFTVRVYQNYQTTDVLFSGYLYSAINQWHDPKAVVSAGSSGLNVKMGRDADGRAYVWLQGGGYRGVAVLDVVGGYAAANWNTGWEISESDTVPNLALDTTIYPPYSPNNKPTPSDIGALPAGSNAVSATKLQSAVTINSVAFDGSSNITITAANPTILTRGTGLTGANYNGASATTWAVAYGTAAGTACQGNDSRLSDARTPLAHSHGVADVTGLQGLLDSKYSSGNTNIGTGASNYAAGNHLHTGVYAAVSHTHDYAPSVSATLLGNDSTVAYGRQGLQVSNFSGVGGTGANGTQLQNPTNEWYHHITLNHPNAGGYYVDIAACFHSDILAFRRVSNGANSGWMTVYHTGNKPTAADVGAAPTNHTHSYAPLTGAGTSGTWPISVTGSSASTTGNAATATTLQTARTINGVSFNGSANITITAAANGGTSAACSGNSATATLASTVVVNGSADNNFYDMLWRSGNTVYAANSSKAQLNPATGDMRLGGHVTFAYTSDENLKSGIREIDSPLAKVCCLRTATYMKRSILEGEDGKFTYTPETGFIAQDLEKVIPDLIQNNDHGYKTIKGGGFEIEALLAGAIKELKKQHDEEIAALKEQIATLMKLI